MIAMTQLRVQTNRLRKGMTIKNTVYSRSGVILIPANTPVTKEIVTLLSRHFIDYVIVEYDRDIPAPPVPEAPDVPVNTDPPKIDEQKFTEFKQSFEVAEHVLSENLIEIVSNNSEVDVPALLGMLNNIVENSEADINLCDMLLRMKKSDEDLYTHSINVSLFSQILAKWMNFEQEEIEIVMISALLHDIGILKYPKEDLAVFRFRNDLAEGRFSKHVITGYNLIKDKSIDNRIKQAVLTHHERLDGKGFPLRITQKNINRYARCIAIADIYDTLTMKEEGIESMSPFAVLNYLEKNGHHKLDSQMLMTFITRISNNFIQHRVLLNTGETGQIVLINKFNVTRPLVQLRESFLDLAIRNDLSIKELLD